MNDDPIRAKLDAVIDALGSYDSYVPAPSDTVMDLVMALRAVLDLCDDWHLSLTGLGTLRRLTGERVPVVKVESVRQAIADALGVTSWWTELEDGT